MRREFTVKTKEAALARSGGVCECGCGRPFGNHPRERPEYDHIVPAAKGGDATLENCMAIRFDCHKAKTKLDVKSIAKARRGERDRVNLKAPTRKIPGSKGSGFRRKLNGTTERE